MGQTWDPDAYARNVRFVSDLGEPVVALLAPRPGERVLDLGCGDGFLTERLVAAGCQVVALDASPEQVAAARRRGLDARIADGQALEFEGAFDAVFSNAALHWMPRQEDVIAGVWRALVPGGRFVGECGGAGNVATLREALREALARRGVDPEGVDPWTFPTAQAHRERLEAQGFRVSVAKLIPRPTPLPGDVIAWLEILAGAFAAALAADERKAFLQEVRERVRPRLCDAAGQWTADYVRLRFAAERPAD